MQFNMFLVLSLFSSCMVHNVGETTDVASDVTKRKNIIVYSPIFDSYCLLPFSCKMYPEPLVPNQRLVDVSTGTDSTTLLCPLTEGKIKCDSTHACFMPSTNACLTKVTASLPLFLLLSVYVTRFQSWGLVQAG